jgi:transcriptional regulator with XRE-family HTH domain
MASRSQSTKRNKSGQKSLKSDSRLSIADVLRTSRLTQRLSQAQLASKLGLRQRQISDLEREAVDARLSTIQNVARSLDLELMLIPRHLISTVEALQRAGREGDQRPLYALDEEEETTPQESYVEVGDTGALTRGEVPKRREPRS